MMSIGLTQVRKTGRGLAGLKKKKELDVENAEFAM